MKINLIFFFPNIIYWNQFSPLFILVVWQFKTGLKNKQVYLEEVVYLFPQNI